MAMLFGPRILQTRHLGASGKKLLTASPESELSMCSLPSGCGVLQHPASPPRGGLACSAPPYIKANVPIVCSQVGFVCLDVSDLAWWLKHMVKPDTFMVLQSSVSSPMSTKNQQN